MQRITDHTRNPICFYLAVILLGMHTMALAQRTSFRCRLITLDPAHFHAALVQKTAYPQVDNTVYVYAPEGSKGLKSHLDLVESYNTRITAPTAWKEEVYTGADFFDRMLREKKGNVVVLAGNNRSKADYISKSIEAGLHVFADKPMAINSAGFEQLKKSFDRAAEKKLLLYDIMTERFQVTNRLQKELSMLPAVFGQLQKGTTGDPAVVTESTHHFFKLVSGKPLVRPDWFFDVEQQGEGIVDVSTHLVDLVQWQCFPNQEIDYSKDIRMLAAKRWPTAMTLSQFREITGTAYFPAFLAKDTRDSVLQVYANGEMNYTIRGVHARIAVMWNYAAPAGTGDTHFSMLKGSKAKLIIRQGAEQGYVPELYIEPIRATPEYEQQLRKEFVKLEKKYPGLALLPVPNGWHVSIPAKYQLDHEATFAEVTKQFLKYLDDGKMPAWEKKGMLAKYYTTTEALRIAVTTNR
ncbi:putative oxidoreductase C-terminal domain-containing protein [Flavihumibacter profundi]|uniref:putative oxidoreductase C-terminal domain-containing protein n=1 Tax=Flavihumibacter profundi TaxID=2716883 RepID=UPI001CC73D84|nr:putative oxidoreductase C-terminal domain-containing protein [Flavihumibacter profundi]MBZ5856856.1 Gfo/Idh/MocA family oxidoreductase [Flavihumibacter profundi]